jgi:hypothetical protein
VDLIRENVGIEVNQKKSRLKKTAQIEHSAQIKGELVEEMVIDTTMKTYQSKVKAEPSKTEPEQKVKR